MISTEHPLPIPLTWLCICLEFCTSNGEISEDFTIISFRISVIYIQSTRDMFTTTPNEIRLHLLIYLFTTILLHPICSRHFLSTEITNMNGPIFLKDTLLFSRREAVRDMSRTQMREAVNSMRIRNQERHHEIWCLFSGSRFRIK